MILAATAGELEAGGALRGVFVPTMGALHEGHASLVGLARSLAGPGGSVVVSVFVNPTQFNEAADFERYPRTIERDAAMCERLGVDVLFCPEPPEVYPPGEEVPVGTLPAVALLPGLEDAQRPGHFAGVCQVVRRLFALARPRAAVFGEKDWQQLQVVRAMVRGEGLGVEVVAAPTVREPDGLAMSSRNRLLEPLCRAAVAAVPRALDAARGESDASGAEGAMRRVLLEAGLGVEYAAIRDAETLLGVAPGRAGRALIAARCGAVRVIDNAPWSPGGAANG